MNPGKYKALEIQMEGELFYDETVRTLYATDASAYREMPEAVAIPANIDDLRLCIDFARKNKTSLIPRTAGTSLAGQVVGKGIVVDVSKHFNQILEVNREEAWVRVQPGVIRDDLNRHLQPYGLFFGPETSTANRAMIGGMLGNNSCGSNSIIYGSTREHVLEVKALLADGSEGIFGELDQEAFKDKLSGKSCASELEQRIYHDLFHLLKADTNRQLITENFPDPDITRRNTGYALDLLMDAAVFGSSDKLFNMCKLLCGSEGTLALLTEIKLSLAPLPPEEELLVCAHFKDNNEALEANLIALKHKPRASELIDHYILECTKSNKTQLANRFFVQGDPGAILTVDLSRNTLEEALHAAHALIDDFKKAGLGYHFPVLHGADAKKIWALRKAGLGLLSNIPGDAKPVAVIEDTVVKAEDLPAFIRDFNKITKKHGLSCVHYGHAATGELHLRPILNLKTVEGTRLFRTILEEIAELVKKYRGSLSGEHGDGRLRGEFIRYMVGDECYRLLEETKRIWDVDNIFNPGKIVNTAPMDTMLRYTPGQDTCQFDTILDFSEYQGILRWAELCNGSGDCRKSPQSGGTMCPSFMATRNEKDTTRARANMLREVLTHSSLANPFDSEALKEVLDLCLSCKGCKSECPSNVDMAKMKAEFLQHYYEANGVPVRSWLIANIARLNKLASIAPGVYNVLSNTSLVKKLAGVATQRSMPRLHTFTLAHWYKKHFGSLAPANTKRKVFFFCDEFTNYNDVEIGIKAIKLLTSLGYEVIIPKHLESGRAYLSKGLLKTARSIAQKNVAMLNSQMNEGDVLVGLEPSAILTFKDEYIDLLRGEEKKQAIRLAAMTRQIDDFLAEEFESGIIDHSLFTDTHQEIKLHGHCHQKALASVVPTKKMLSIPLNYSVQMIPSGCCGMAGSFGYEKEHYELSMQVGELILFPTIRKTSENTLIVAPGTSCRHQIADGTGRRALHPVEVLYDALKQKG